MLVENTKEIGGYFELELPDHGGFLHDDGVLLNSGRNALEYVLRSFAVIRHIWIPYFTCDAVLEPIKKLSLSYSFYHINLRLEIADEIELGKDDYLLYTNYFGIKDQYTFQLAERYGAYLILDNAQAWYAKPIPGINTIYSPRKFVGVPDGGIAYCRDSIDVSLLENDFSFNRCSHLLKRIDLGPQRGYSEFKDNDNGLAGQPMRRMSRLTKRLLCSIDFNFIKHKRVANYQELNKKLQDFNGLVLPEDSMFQCPMVYPFLSSDSYSKKRLIENHIFVATYWPNVIKWVSEDCIEREFVSNLLPLPCDQRYFKDEMNAIQDLL